MNKDDNIIITAAAQQAIRQEVLRRKGNDRVRFGVRASGCNGFSYVLQYNDAAPHMNDYHFAYDGFDILIDAKSMKIIKGMTVDYEKTLLKQGFIFSNPQAQSGCGCGKSFGIKKKEDV